MTILGKNVVVVTPAGRKRYLTVLFNYILKLKPFITEYRLWVNTKNEEDITFMKTFQEQNADFVTLDTIDEKLIDGTNSIRYFFKNCCDDNTVYVRFDDDIVFVDTDRFVDFVKFRILHPEYFLVFGNIINNAIISHIHQRHGSLGIDHGLVGYLCMDSLGWKNGQFAEYVLKNFIDKKFNTLAFKMNNWILYHYERVSINCISWLGNEFKSFGGTVFNDEEQYITEIKPKEIKKMNIIYGDFCCVHYAFFTQRPVVDNNPSILDAFLEKSKLV